MQDILHSSKPRALKKMNDNCCWIWCTACWTMLMSCMWLDKPLCLGCALKY